MSPKNTGTERDPGYSHPGSSRLDSAEPTPEQLAREEELMKEDLADLDTELQKLGIQTRDKVLGASGKNGKPNGKGNREHESRVKKISAPPASPRMARLPKTEKGAAQPAKKQKAPLPTPKAVLPAPSFDDVDYRSEDFSVDIHKVIIHAKSELLEAGIIPAGMSHKGMVGVGISTREAAQKIMALQKPDVLALIRILLTWKQERHYRVSHVRSLLQVIDEGRKASIPGLLQAIAESPAEVMPKTFQVPSMVRKSVRGQVHDKLGDLGTDFEMDFIPDTDE